jgi:hypothetical protein
MKAYPFQHKNPTSGLTTMSEGMELRDWFAGLVLQALFWQGSNVPDLMVYKAYEVADLMMQQRLKEVSDEQHSTV